MKIQPTIWTRFVCLLQGEVSADTLEAYRRASLAVLDLLEQAEQERLSAAADGKNSWTMPAAKQSELACTWNAFVLQTLGNAFLDADYRDQPATAGFVPPVTADQVLRFYTPVEGWLTRAQQAHADPNYRLDLTVPADLPPWSEVEPCPNSHLHGMQEAMRAIRDHAQAAMNVLENAKDLTPEQEKQRGIIRGLFAAAITKARYADDMHSQNPSRDVHERMEEHLKVAIEQLFKVGQLAAVPQRANQNITPIATPQPAPKPLTMPVRQALIRGALPLAPREKRLQTTGRPGRPSTRCGGLTPIPRKHLPSKQRLMPPFPAVTLPSPPTATESLSVIFSVAPGQASTP